jgi:putative hydrolase of the HAD superfamily
MISRTIPGRIDPPAAAVLFDLDRTLCDYDAARLTRTRYAFEPHFPEPERLERAVAAALAHAGDGSDHFEAILAEHGIRDSRLVVAARERYVEDRYRGLHLFDDALEVIAAVAGVAAIGLVTNGPTAIQGPKIALLHLDRVFDVIVVSEDVGAWKPDPAIFRIALERVGVVPEAAVYVGDSAEHDVPGAHAAGMRAVWLNRNGIAWPGARPPDAEIRDLRALLPLIGLDR